MSNLKTYPDDVARLICGSIDDLKCYLPGTTDVALIESAIAHCAKGREMGTKKLMLERHLRKLQKAKQSTLSQ